MEEDAALARQVAASAGDARAEAELCRRFAPRIRLYGLRHLRDEHAADDLVQEVLALTLTTLREGRLRDPSMLASFVLGTCRHVVLNGRRTERRQRALIADFAAEQPTSVEAELGNDDRRLAACLARLGERERAVVLLSYYADRTGAQIAAELALSAANVRVVRHRALARLLGCMGVDQEAS